MTFRTILAALALAAAAPALAQQDQTAAPQTEDSAPEELRQAAQGYVNSQAMQTALDELLSTETFVAQLEASGMRLDPEQTRTLAGIVDEEFAEVRPELEDAMATAASDAFSMEELEALNDFYGSEEGRSIATKMSPFMQSFYEEIGPTLRQTQEQIAARAQDALEPAGEGEAPPAVTE
jgi:hypothetical protein